MLFFFFFSMCFFFFSFFFFFFFFNDTATTEIYTLSLHDALPISVGQPVGVRPRQSLDEAGLPVVIVARGPDGDRKSTRLNSSHVANSYAVFCLKKKQIHVTVDPHLALAVIAELGGFQDRGTAERLHVFNQPVLADNYTLSRRHALHISDIVPRGPD